MMALQQPVLSLISAMKKKSLQLYKMQSSLQTPKSLQVAFFPVLARCSRLAPKTTRVALFQRFEFQLPQLLLILKQDVEGRERRRTVVIPKNEGRRREQRGWKNNEELALLLPLKTKSQPDVKTITVLVTVVKRFNPILKTSGDMTN